ncbi:MAG: VanZ family protein, partial [Prevotella sp.]|nr:VanZ family protein [Prevotella sp.]
NTSRNGRAAPCGQSQREDRTIDYVFGLLDIPWWYYAIAVVVGLAVWRSWKKPSLGALVAYSFLILAETILTRKPFAGSHFQPELFWSWRAWDKQSGQVIANVIMFIPVGVLSGWLWKWKGLWFAAGLSFFVETFQLVTQRGLMEFDDVIHNCLGAAVGIVVLKIFMRLRGGAKDEF